MKGTRVNLATEMVGMKYEIISEMGKNPFISGWVISQFRSNITLNNCVQILRILNKCLNKLNKKIVQESLILHFYCTTNFSIDLMIIHWRLTGEIENFFKYILKKNVQEHAFVTISETFMLTKEFLSILLWCSITFVSHLQ